MIKKYIKNFVKQDFFTVGDPKDYDYSNISDETLIELKYRRLNDELKLLELLSEYNESKATYIKKRKEIITDLKLEKEKKSNKIFLNDKFINSDTYVLNQNDIDRVTATYTYSIFNGVLEKTEDYQKNIAFALRKSYDSTKNISYEKFIESGYLKNISIDEMDGNYVVKSFGMVVGKIHNNNEKLMNDMMSLFQNKTDSKFKFKTEIFLFKENYEVTLEIKLRFNEPIEIPTGVLNSIEYLKNDVTKKRESLLKEHKSLKDKYESRYTFRLKDEIEIENLPSLIAVKLKNEINEIDKYRGLNDLPEKWRKKNIDLSEFNYLIAQSKRK